MSRTTLTVCALITLAMAQICYSSPSDGKPMAYRWWQDGVFISVINGTVKLVLEDENSAVRSIEVIARQVVVVKKHFAKIPSLESLSLEDNLIEAITNDVFHGLPNLLSLNLARNRISTLYPKTFAGLTKLESLNLKHNALAEVAFSFDVETLPKLTHLYLQNNRIEKCDGRHGTDLEKTINVSHLYLSNNQIHFFDSWNYKNLTHLYLEYNSVHDYNFWIPSLLSLSLDGNALYRISIISSNLTSLSLAKTELSFIDATQLENSNISHLILSRNAGLMEVCAKVEPKIDSLRYLAVDYTYIRWGLDRNGFACFPFLTHLDISGNQLTSITPKMFTQVPYLQELVIADNRLTSFINTDILSRTKINYLDLSYNQLGSISDLYLNAIPELKYVKIEGNPLMYIEPSTVGGNATVCL